MMRHICLFVGVYVLMLRPDDLLPGYHPYSAENFPRVSC